MNRERLDRCDCARAAMTPAAIALLRLGWRAEDFAPGMLATAPMRGKVATDFIVRIVSASHEEIIATEDVCDTWRWRLCDDGWRVDAWREGWDPEAVTLTATPREWTPDLHDPATFALALRVLGRRVGVVMPDGDPRPLVWVRSQSVRGAQFFWILQLNVFGGPIGAEPDPVTALAMALAQTAEVPRD